MSTCGRRDRCYKQSPPLQPKTCKTSKDNKPVSPYGLERFVFMIMILHYFCFLFFFHFYLKRKNTYEEKDKINSSGCFSFIVNVIIINYLERKNEKIKGGKKRGIAGFCRRQQLLRMRMQMNWKKDRDFLLDNQVIWPVRGWLVECQSSIRRKCFWFFFFAF